MKKIAVITPFIARGGLEKIAVVEAQELSKYYDVTLIVLDSFIKDYPYEGKLIDLGVSLEERDAWKRVKNIYLATWRLCKIKKEYGFDAVISHGELSNFPNILSGGKNNIITIHENRFGGLKDLQGKLVNKVLNYLYQANSVKKIVTVSEGIREILLKSTSLRKDQVVAIGNPHNIDEIKQLSQEPLNEFESLFSKKRVLISVGRLIQEKGQWYLLRIFAKIKQGNPDLRLVILGDAGLRDQLISLSEDLELKTFSQWRNDTYNDEYDVYFLGFQNNPFRFIANSELFLMTSIKEGLPNTIIEALACGKHVMSSDCKTGPREILFPGMDQNFDITIPTSGDAGTLIPPFKKSIFLNAKEPLNQEEDFWVHALSDYFTHGNLSLNPEECTERANDFKLERIISKWMNLIDNTLNREFP